MMQLQWITRRAATGIPGVGAFEKVLQYRNQYPSGLYDMKSWTDWQDVPEVGINGLTDDEASG